MSDIENSNDPPIWKATGTTIDGISMKCWTLGDKTYYVTDTDTEIDWGDNSWIHISKKEWEKRWGNI